MSIESDLRALNMIANQRCVCTPEQQSGDDPTTCIICMASSSLNDVAEQLRNDVEAIRNAEIKPAKAMPDINYGDSISVVNMTPFEGE